MPPPTCAAHGCSCGDHPSRRTLADAVTVVRTSGSLALAPASLAAHSWPLLRAAHLVHRVGDVPPTLLRLRWPALSPSCFALVDPWVHAWSWRPVAEATSTALLVVLLLVVPDHRVALAAACAVLAVKMVSPVRVVRLPVPSPGMHVGELALTTARA